MKNRFTRLLPVVLLFILFFSVQSQLASAGIWTNIQTGIQNFFNAKLQLPGSTTQVEIVYILLTFVIFLGLFYTVTRRFIPPFKDPGGEKYLGAAKGFSAALAGLVVLASPVAEYLADFFAIYFSTLVAWLLFIFFIVALWVILFRGAGAMGKVASEELVAQYGREKTEAEKLAERDVATMKAQEDTIEGTRKLRAKQALDNRADQAEKQITALIGPATALPANLTGRLTLIRDVLREAHAGLDGDRKKQVLKEAAAIAPIARDLGNVVTAQVEAWNRIRSIANECFALLDSGAAGVAVDLKPYLAGRARALGKVLPAAIPAASAALNPNNKPDANWLKLEKIAQEIAAPLKAKKQLFLDQDAQVKALVKSMNTFKGDIGKITKALSDGDEEGVAQALQVVTGLLQEGFELQQLENKFRQIFRLARQASDEADRLIDDRLDELDV